MLRTNSSIGRMNCYRLVFIAALLITMLLPRNGNCNAQSNRRLGNVYEVLEKEDILAKGFWNINNEVYLCIVTFHKTVSEGVSIPHRKLLFFKKVGNRFEEAYKFEPGDIFLSMHPLGENGNLMTVWISGSAYRLYIFSIVEGEITVVLEEGTKIMPEILDIDNDGKSEILISTGSFLIDKEKGKILSYPEKTRIYKWNGDSYNLLTTVPWEKRGCSVKVKED